MKTLVVFSDPHSNSTVGLADTTIQLDDGDKVAAGPIRRWLWYRYQETLDYIAKHAKGEIYGVLNGDAVELDAKNRSQQVISPSQEKAIEIANSALTPFFELCKGVYVDRGTEAHTGPSAQAEEAIANNFDNSIKNTEANTSSWWHLPLIFDGVKMDIAHHPRGGNSGRPSGRQNLVNRMAHDAFFEYAEEGQRPPHLVIRSHLHGYKDSFGAYKTRAIITPAFSLLTAYGRRIGINKDNDVGMIMITCDNGEYEIKPILHETPRPQWVSL